MESQTSDTAQLFLGQALRVEVTVDMASKRYFSAMLGSSDDVDISAQSAALVEASGEACLLALDANGNGVELGGNTDVSLSGCLVMSNATTPGGAS